MAVTINTVPLAIGSRALTEEVKFLKHDLRGLERLVAGEGYNTMYGAHETSLAALSTPQIHSSWKDCLGDVASTYSSDTYKTPVMYFPSCLRTAGEVERWCNFMNDVLGYTCRYIGESFVSHTKYAGLVAVQPQKHIRSHVIMFPYQADLYATSKKAALSKVTLIRYIYRTNHYEKLILPLYQMVDAGTPAWDAIFLAHYHGFNNGIVYSSGRGLFYNDDGTFPIMYPRSYDDVKKLFVKFDYINRVWGSNHLSNTLFFYPHISENEFHYSMDYFRLDYPFGPTLEPFRNPHSTYKRKMFNVALASGNWMAALGIYYSALLPLRNILTSIKNNHETFIKISGRRFLPQGTALPNETYNHVHYIDDIFNFISTFEP